MRRFVLLVAALAVAGFLVAPTIGSTAARQPLSPGQALCSSGYVDAIIGGQHKCLRAGEFCAPNYESDYEHYGFTCVAGHLKADAPTTTTTTTTQTTTAQTTTAQTTTSSTMPVSPGVGHTVLLARRTKTSGCTPGPNPDRRCSPGAYHSGLTKAVICAPRFRTGSIRNVPDSEKHADEVEYGMAPRAYGRTIEIDHIVSLELGGSNDIANLFPEPGSGPANYHFKDKLENKLHSLVCAGSMTLHSAQVGIARNWRALYKHVYGVAPAA